MHDSKNRFLFITASLLPIPDCILSNLRLRLLIFPIWAIYSVQQVYRKKISNAVSVLLMGIFTNNQSFKIFLGNHRHCQDIPGDCRAIGLDTVSRRPHKQESVLI